MLQPFDTNGLAGFLCVDLVYSRLASSQHAYSVSSCMENLSHKTEQLKSWSCSVLLE
jgi:hypothetical protein